jgi:phosphate transport system substrate-binding protein
MVYIPPKGIDASQINDLLYVQGNSDLSDPHSINNLLSIFSGYNDGIVGNATLGDFVKSTASPDIKQALSQQPIIPYVRTGGALVSGTAASFYNGTHFANISLTQRQKDAFNFGNYGNARLMYSTDEANSRA